MIKEAIRHTGTYPDIYLKDRQTLSVTLQTAKKDKVKCQILYFSRTSPHNVKTAEMTCVLRDDLFDYYRCEIRFSHPVRYQKYFFQLKGTDEICYLSAWGISENEPQDGYFEFLYANQTEIVHVPEWSKGQVYYQIFPERFCNGNPEWNPDNCEEWGTLPTRENYMGGDLKGIIAHLEYLEELGIDSIYLNPVFKADFNHKYATTDYFTIDPIFGGNEAFRELVEKAHKKGIKIILDGVFNHTGIHFPPFADILKNQENSRYTSWYYITKYPVTISTECYECVGAYPYMPKLNTRNPEVREKILEIMAYWIQEYHIDGWRLDVSDEVDESVWMEARIRLKQEFPDILLLGETWGSGLRLMDGLKMDCIMNYTFRDATRDFFAYEKIDAKAFDSRIQSMLAKYPDDMNQAMFLPLDSHDTERFLYYCRGNKEKMRLAITFQMTFAGSPSVYYGDEIGMTGDNDPDCRRCMIWEKEKQDQELLELYKKLIHLRKQEQCIKTGKFAVNLCEGRLYGFVRYDEGKEIYIVINGDENEQTAEIPVFYKKQYMDWETGQEYMVETAERKECCNSDIYHYEGIIPIHMEPLSTIILISKGGNNNEKI